MAKESLKTINIQREGYVQNSGELEVRKTSKKSNKKIGEKHGYRQKNTASDEVGHISTMSRTITKIRIKVRTTTQQNHEITRC